ncbi:type II secretion protein F [Cellulomonas sp. URHE0023]|uniref:type II secretion protein F n=1 Tax=Cellulomonas sp. URHE0023 TaxID=1380354 RepID=UPI000AF07533|nr:type II secretion protein F [Cellulomonas sp. URHE0023]
MTALVGIAVALAVLVLGVRVPRRLGARVTPPSGGRRPRVSPTDAQDLSVVLSTVAAQLRSGAPPAEAWARALSRRVGRVPAVAELVGVPSRHTRRGREARVQRAAAVVAAARLSDDLGAPLAAVLDRVGAGLAADEECEHERQAALAGPRATAQVLAWLPLLGLVLGVALGANPVAVVLRGGVGTAAAALGAVLVLLGRWWTASLLVRAERDRATSAGRRAGPVPGTGLSA